MVEIKNTLKEIEKINTARKEQDSEQKQIKIILLKNNLKIAIFKDTIKTICEIWNKYTGKQYGEKTKDKIKKEIEQTFDNNFFIHIGYDYIYINLRNETKQYNHSFFDSLKIYTKYGDFHPLKNNTIQKIDPTYFYIYGVKNYIKNIDTTILKIQQAHQKALEYQKKILDLSYILGDLTGGEIQPIEYKYIVKNYLI